MSRRENAPKNSAELDRAKTTFFSNVSHELRTPLTLILGPIEDALTNQAPPSPSLEMLHRNALRLLKLVNGLLDFVRIEVGRCARRLSPPICRCSRLSLPASFAPRSNAPD